MRMIVFVQPLHHPPLSESVKSSYHTYIHARPDYEHPGIGLVWCLASCTRGIFLRRLCGLVSQPSRFPKRMERKQKCRRGRYRTPCPMAKVVTQLSSAKLSSPASRHSLLRSARRLMPWIRPAHKLSAGDRNVTPRCEEMTPILWSTAFRESRPKTAGCAIHSRLFSSS